MFNQFDIITFFCGFAISVITAMVGQNAWRNRKSLAGAPQPEGAGRTSTKRGPWMIHPLLPGLMVMLLLGGSGAIMWRSHIIDSDLRKHMLYQATAIARQIDVAYVRALSFTIEDRSNPAFQRLRHQMTAYAQAMKLRSLYSIAIRNERMVFGPESLAEKDPFASPPGTLYAKPPPEILAVFETGAAQTLGPYTDEYGSFVTACAPVADPRSGEILLVIGIDMEAETWQVAVARARLGPMLFTLVLMSIVLGGGFLLGRRRMIPVERQGRLRHIELWLTAVIGLLLTAGAVYVAHDSDARFRRTRFAQLAESQAGSVSKALHDLRDFRLETIGHFFEASREVERDEFLTFSDQLLRRDKLVQAWQWIPAIPADAKAQFEETAHRNGLSDFLLYEKDLQGRHRPVEGRDIYYPVYYQEQQLDSKFRPGFDIGSEPSCRAALEAAQQTGLTTATVPLGIVSEAGTRKGMLVFRPVFGDTESKKALRGFAAAVVRFDSLTEAALAQYGHQPGITRLGLFQLDTEHPPRLLASAAPEGGQRDCVENTSGFDDDLDVSVTVPLFAFSRTFAVRVCPGPSFLAANPLQSSWGVGLTGLLLTAVLTLLVGILAEGRNALESQVLARTAELRQSEERYRMFFATAQDCVFITLLEGGIVDCNDAAVALFGYDSKEHLLSVNARDLYLVPEDRVKHLAILQETGFVREQPVQMKKRDGTVISTFMSAMVREDANGSVIGMLATVRNVTAQMNAEKALRESESKLNRVVSAAQDAIIILDPQGCISLWNESAVRIFGYPAEEALGRNLHGLLAPHRFQKDHQTGFVEFSLSGKGRAIGQVLELAALRKNGDEFPVELSLSSVQLNGEWHAIGILRDITERKRSQDVLIEANQQLALAITRANEMASQAELASIAKSEFLANMSHEIRTPMNGVIGMTGLLLDTDLSDEQRQYAELARTSGEALLSLVNDILDFSRVEARQLDLEILNFNLLTTIEDTTDLLAHKAHEKGLELVCMVDPRTPLRLRGDPGRLRQVLVNVAGNAVKFTPSGSVILRVGLEHEDAARAVIRFVVTDTGIGVPRNRFHALFSPFTQVDGSTTRRYGGTGLGLSISKQLVELMGGQLGVESEEGKGSTFWFTATFEKQAETAPAAHEVHAELNGERILVVDDHAANRLLLTTLLHHWGCRFDQANDGKSALAMLRDAAVAGDPYRVALVAAHLPQMHGKELVRCIKDDPQCRATALVMMAGAGRCADVGRVNAAGTVACLTKPIRQSQLHDVLALALGKRAGEGRAAAGPAPAHPHGDDRQPYRGRILLVEGNTSNQQVALTSLKRLGCRADAVADGKEALETLSSIPYDLVLMDCHMLQMDGYEATRRIRDPLSNVLNHAVPVIAMTAGAMTGDREQCFEAGMNDYLVKPVAPQTLAKILDKWLPAAQETGKSPMPRSEGKARRAGGDGQGAFPGSQPVTSSAATASPQSGRDSRVFDKAVLLRGLMGDEELLPTIVAGFLEDLPTQLEALKNFLRAGDVRRVQQQAQTVKGAAANIGAEVLREVASEMEKASSSGDVQALASIMPQLEREFLRLKECLRLET